jgi:hypothetical protein
MKDLGGLSKCTSGGQRVQIIRLRITWFVNIDSNLTQDFLSKTAAARAHARDLYNCPRTDLWK